MSHELGKTVIFLLGIFVKFRDGLIRIISRTDCGDTMWNLN